MFYAPFDYANPETCEILVAKGTVFNYAVLEWLNREFGYNVFYRKS